MAACVSSKIVGIRSPLDIDGANNISDVFDTALHRAAEWLLCRFRRHDAGHGLAMLGDRYFRAGALHFIENFQAMCLEIRGTNPALVLQEQK